MSTKNAKWYKTKRLNSQYDGNIKDKIDEKM